MQETGPRDKIAASDKEARGYQVKQARDFVAQTGVEPP
jgi:hypothetical protein